MTKTYFRPLGLCYGSDAEQLIASRRAGRLGGSRVIGFTLVERIKRDGKSISREIIPYTEALQAIEVPRVDFAGLTMDGPKIMGIVNVTPDSFSDGGQHGTSDAGAAHGLALTAEGSHILDVGGESTRPGSNAVSVDEELSRVVPVIKRLSEAGLVVSIDTRKPLVMREAVKAGAAIINDVSALQHDPDSLRTVAELKVPVVLMHAQGDPRTMQLNPHYDDVALDVYDQLEQRVLACVQAGIPRSHIATDPGIGFGKTFRHNLELLNQLTLFHGLGVVVLVGLSRKGFIGALTGEKNAGNRVHGSVGGAVQASLNGVHILRVHDVKGTVEALAVAGAAMDPRSSEF
ncbi:MAG TPA: dihydropteroate synthase [Aestuariivirga sp.]|nr:dihydropteroate synthase [Aestuariivirga sp.]